MNKNLNRFSRNVRTIAANPKMFYKFLVWQGKYLGVEPRIRPDKNSSITGFSSFGEYWSSDSLMPSLEEKSFISRYVSKCGAVLDVGANLGVFTAVLSGLLPQCEIHSFEPTPATFDGLVRNVESNKLAVHCHKIALGSASGVLDFSTNPKSPATNKLILDGVIPDGGSVIRIPVKKLDDLADELGIEKVAFIKIDVEGFEEDVLKGGEKLFLDERVELGLIEICPGNLFKLGRSVADLLAAVDECGCELRSIDADGGIGEVMNEDMIRNVSLTNGALVPFHRRNELL